MTTNQNQSLERNIPKVSGWLTLIIGIALLIYIIYGIYDFYSPKPMDMLPPLYLCIKGIILSITAGCLFSCLLIIKPNEAVVYTFLGHYKGTLRGPGFFSVPFWWSNHETCDLALQTVHVEDIAVNDQNGNPIIIGCSIFCKQEDTYAATFEVSDVDSYLDLKANTALRALAMKYPMDSVDNETHTLRGNADEVKADLLKEVSNDFVKAGFVVDSVALTSLHYSSEIAGLMLQRQQAQATIDARKTITEGAIGIVKEAIEKMETEARITLSPANKEKLASNLLITLCSHQGVSPAMEIHS